MLVTILLLQGIFCFALLPNTAAQEADSAKPETLSHQSIVEMTGAGLTSNLIVTKIKASKTAFDTSAALQALKKAGVADAVIMAMVQKESGISVCEKEKPPKSKPERFSPVTLTKIKLSPQIKAISLLIKHLYFG